MFPSNIVAGMFNFKPEAFFEVTEEERKNVQVKFQSTIKQTFFFKKGEKESEKNI